MPAPVGTILASITLAGSVFALLVATILLVFTRKAKNPRNNWFLAALIIGMSLSSILAAVTFSGWVLQAPHLFRVDSPLHYVLTVLLYYYVKTSIYRDYQLRTWDWLFLLPGAIHLVEMIPFYLQDAESKRANFLYLVRVKGDLAQHVHVLLKNGYSLLMNGLSLYVYLDYRKRAKAAGFPQNIVHNQWITYLITITFVYSALWLVKLLLGEQIPIPAYTYNSFFSSMSNTFGVLFLLFCPSILYGAMFEEAFPNPQQVAAVAPATVPESIDDVGGLTGTAQTTDESIKYKSSPLSPEQKRAYFEQLQSYANQYKPYLNGKLSLHELAFDLDMSPHYLSQVINEVGGYSFVDYLNQYRVQHAKQMIASHKMEQLNIAGIGAESGFNSRATFYKAFKKFTNMTPTEYAAQFQAATTSAA